MPNQKIRGYLTEYRTQNRHYVSYVIAKNRADLENKINLRGLDEQVTSKRIIIPASVLIEKLSINSQQYFLNRENSLSILHYVCFLCFLAIRAGKLSGTEILSDPGYMHDFIHFFLFDIDRENTARLNAIIEKLATLENFMIGVFGD